MNKRAIDDEKTNYRERAMMFEKTKFGERASGKEKTRPEKRNPRSIHEKNER